jgi:WD40 repeat protein
LRESDQREERMMLSRSKWVLRRSAVHTTATFIFVVASTVAIAGTPTVGAIPAHGIDVNQIAYVRCCPQNNTLGLVDADGSHRRTITLPPAGSGFGISNPQLTPDGSKIVFGLLNSAGLFEIAMINIDGSGFTTLDTPSAQALEPSVSPDGSRVAYVGFYSGGKAEIWTQNLDGSDPVLLTTGPDDSSPSWSPGGGQVAFLAGSDQIDVVPATGGAVRQLTHLTGSGTGLLLWSPNGAFIEFQEASPDGQSMAMVLNVATGAVSTLFGGPYAYGVDSWAPNSTDLLSTANGSIGVISIVNLQGQVVGTTGVNGFASSWIRAQGTTAPIVGMNGIPSGTGYQMVTSDGSVLSYGQAAFYGAMNASALTKPIVGMASTPDGGGYWLVASDGGVFSFGDASFYGSTGATRLNKPIVGMASTPDGGGYWLVASDGGVFSFGDANFYGSTGATRLNQPVVGIASTHDGAGYWLVAADGGIFSFGDARFDGSTGALHLNKPIVGMAATADGGGYWLVASDGGVFTFGNAGFYGSTGAMRLNQPIVGMASAPDGHGYWLVARDGGLFSFGNAGFFGSTP